MNTDDKTQEFAKWQSSVFTLMGHAAWLRSQGHLDMSSWAYELAEKIAGCHLDSAHATRVREIARSDQHDL